MGGRARAAEPAIVLDCSPKVLVAARQHKEPAPGLGCTDFLEPQQVPPGESGVEELGRPGNPASLVKILKNFHAAI